VGLNVSGNGVFELPSAAVHATTNLFFGQQGEPAFDQVDPGGASRFVLPPCSPKLNGQEECYEVTPCSLPIADLNRELEAWERIYNTVRPHQALGRR